MQNRDTLTIIICLFAGIIPWIAWYVIHYIKDNNTVPTFPWWFLIWDVLVMICVIVQLTHLAYNYQRENFTDNTNTIVNNETYHEEYTVTPVYYQVPEIQQSPMYQNDLSPVYFAPTYTRYTNV